MSQSGLYQSVLSLWMADYICVLPQTRLSESGLYQSANGLSLWTAYYFCTLSQTRVSQSGLSKSKLSVTRVSCLTVSCPMGGQVLMWSVSEWVLTVS